MRARGPGHEPVVYAKALDIIWQGKFEIMLIGPGDERWDICFISKYPSVSAFVEMIRDPVCREAVKHRQAAVEDSRLIRFFGPLMPGPGCARSANGNSDKF
jgi:hypothetical protein